MTPALPVAFRDFIEVTIDDHGAFSRPFTVRFNATLSPQGDELMEYICHENNQFGVAGLYKR